jgi:hypothetical protein
MKARNDFRGQWFDIYPNQIQVGTSAPVLESFRETANDPGFQNYFFRHDQDNELQMRFELDHGQLVPGDMRFHLHTLPMANGAGNVYWQYWHTLAVPDGTAIPRALASWTTGFSTQAVLAADQYKQKMQSVFTYTVPAGTSLASVLFVKLKRLGSTGGASDTYKTGKESVTAAANMGFITAGCHIQRAYAGTVTEFA